MGYIKKINFYLILLLFFSSCAYKNSIPNQVKKEITSSIFISMPENNIIFENISQIIYKTINNYYLRVGYNIQDSEKKVSYILKIKIKDISPVHKFISPDLLPYNIKVRLDLTCQLLDFDKNLLAEKTFNFYTIEYRPKDPILNTSFLDYLYKRLMERSVPKIEQYFRKILIKNEKLNNDET